MAELTLDDVTKVFVEDDGNQIVAVDEVSVDIRDGEFLVLVGPSGCGKSTTLRMIAGLESITDGEIRLGGEVMNQKEPKDRDIAMVFQSYALYPHMTVRENMAFGLEESTDMADDKIDERVSSAAEIMDIEELLDRKPKELSGGQQQRVALGRAIVRDPEVFLMDEPLSNLDAKLRSHMRTELQRIQENLGTTTVYVTHDQTEAMTMSDRIAVLDDGRLQQAGTPLECYHEPANEFVAGFMGEPSMNIMDVEVQGNQLRAEHFTYPVSDETLEAIGDRTELRLGIRPEDVRLTESGSGSHHFDTVVDVVEPMGDENSVYLTFETGGDIGSGIGDIGDDDEAFVVTVGGMQQVEAGQPVVAEIPEEAVHLFDANTGEAVKNRSLDEVEALGTRV